MKSANIVPQIYMYNIMLHTHYAAKSTASKCLEILNILVGNDKHTQTKS